MATPLPPNEARFTAAEIAFAAQGTLVRGAPDTTAVGVSTDSRALHPESLFVALRGETHDAHHFLRQATDRGARVIVVAPDADISSLPGDVAVVVVRDTVRALGALAARHRDRWARLRGGRVVVVGVTGSSGKTTTKELCAAALCAQVGVDAVLATMGNLNNAIGVPLTLLSLTARHAAAVIEIGTSCHGEIRQLGEIVRPHVGALVNVGIAHAEGLLLEGASPHESVAREKGALIAAATHFAVVCGDDPWARATLSTELRAHSTRTFGWGPGCDYRVAGAVADAERGSRVALDRPACEDEGTPERLSLAIPMVGRTAASNLAGAVAAADCAAIVLGGGPIDGSRLATALSSRVRPVPGRLTPRRRGDGALVLDDTYNANPASYEAAIEAAESIAAGTGRRLIVIAGEMRELGALAAEAHDAVGARLSRAKPALVVSCGGGADRIASVAERHAITVYRATDAGHAARFIAPQVRPDDVVLVKGSRGVACEVVVDAILAAPAAPTAPTETARREPAGEA